MIKQGGFWQGRRIGAFLAILMLCGALFFAWRTYEEQTVLRIYDWRTGRVYREIVARSGDKLFFGWEHSLEKIPWNEYYHVDGNLELVLDAITFPAFGAGIPENKGRVCYVKDGLIHMEEIDQRFSELVWLNSHTATRDIVLNGALVARGSDLPQHTRLRLVVERGNMRGTR